MEAGDIQRHHLYAYVSIGRECSIPLVIENGARRSFRRLFVLDCPLSHEPKVLYERLP